MARSIVRGAAADLGNRWDHDIQKSKSDAVFSTHLVRSSEEDLTTTTSTRSSKAVYGRAKVQQNLQMLIT